MKKGSMVVFISLMSETLVLVTSLSCLPDGESDGNGSSSSVMKKMRQAALDALVHMISSTAVIVL
jgi:hypothetical protein